MNYTTRDRLLILTLGSLSFIPCIAVLSEKPLIKFVGLLWSWIGWLIVYGFQNEMSNMKSKQEVDGAKK